MSNDLERHGKIGNSEIEIGRFTYGIENINVKQYGEGAKFRVGSFCSIAKSITVFLGGNHRVDWITTFPFGHIFAEELGGSEIKGHPATKGDVIIGDDVWIGHNVTIMSGVTIGCGAVLAANSTVTKDVDDYTIVGGNPAKIIKRRFDVEIIDLLLELRWWDLPTEVIRSASQELSAEPTAEWLSSMIKMHRTSI